MRIPKNGLDPSQVLQEAEVLKFLSAETSTVWRGAEKISNGSGLGKAIVFFFPMLSLFDFWFMARG